MPLVCALVPSWNRLPQTGTLTEGRMRTEHIYAGEELFELSGEGFNPAGEIVRKGTSKRLSGDDMPSAIFRALQVSHRRLGCCSTETALRFALCATTAACHSRRTQRVVQERGTTPATPRKWPSRWPRGRVRSGERNGNRRGRCRAGHRCARAN